MREKIKNLLKELTLDEKAALTSGISSWDTTPITRLGIPSVFLADGPHGVRREVAKATLNNIFMASLPATCFPPAVTLASSWDRKLVYEVGEAIADECLEQKVDVILGPGMNIKRNPMCGRNFEYFSEDPYQAGELASAYIDGVQSKGVGVSLKHFAVNSQEYRRLIASSEVDERTLREIYLAGFERAVKKSQPATIMCSYNPINNLHASDNKRLLTDILRDEWGYKGIVVSDWGAVNDRVKSIFAGLNLEMPSSNGIHDREIVNAVKSGKLPFEVLDNIVAEILEFVFKCVDNRAKYPDYKADYDKNHRLARKAAAQGIVLLKNKDNILPLDPKAHMAVIGQLAKKMRSQGSGSSKVNAKNEVSFVDYLKEVGADYEYAAGYSVNDDAIKMNTIIKACNAAVDKDVAIVFIGLTESYESESFDRVHIDLPPIHNALIDELAERNKNIVVVLTGGSPVTMPWLDKVSAVINVYLGGEASGEATYDVLFGNVNPSGHLPETYPININDELSTHYFGKDVAQYRESIYVGYRYFDSAKKSVLFPFGYGLSYTTFEYSDLVLDKEIITDSDTLTASFNIKNTGDYDGSEVAQVYVRDTESSIYVAEKQLKGFEKVFLKKGETKRVTVTLDKRSFAFYNVLSKDWTVEAGDFQIMVGSSSRDIRLTATVRYDSAPFAIPDYRETGFCYNNIDKVGDIPLKQFEALLGRCSAEYVKPKRGHYTFNTVVGELNATWFCKLFRIIFKRSSLSLLPKDASYATKKMTQQGAVDMPIRNFYAMSAGAVPYEACVGLLIAFNGQFFKGVFKLAYAFLHKPKDKADIYK